ncbi:sulfurtransferase [Spongiibacter sp.]|uniref:sulfurtransferase n=1 Tax=Spongiibacter sp. TaxID=2024860 RepID=UPI003564F3C1
MSELALLIEAEELEKALGQANLLILDTSSRDNYLRHHIPGALHISPAELQRGEKPAVGKIPRSEKLREVFSRVGLQENSHVVVYDDEGGGWAGRLIWTLDAIGHHNYSYLNGGLHAWLAGGHATDSGEQTTQPSEIDIHIDSSPIAEMDGFVHLLGNSQLAIWDARSPEEYRGEKVLAARGGHIPGAVNLDWLELIDKDRDYRLKDLQQLRDRLTELGITPDHMVITHCQTHHRSGLSYLLMKILGFPHIKGYDGSWGEWGNHDDTPIATGDQP